MEVEERVDLIEGEVTLIKGEIKQALIELREMVTNRPIRGPESDVQRIEIHQTSDITQSSNVPQVGGTSEANPGGRATGEVGEEQPSSEIDQELAPAAVGEEDAGSLSQPTGGLEVEQQPEPGNSVQAPREASLEPGALEPGALEPGALEPGSSIFDLIPGQNQAPSQEMQSSHHAKLFSPPRDCGKVSKGCEESWVQATTH